MRELQILDDDAALSDGALAVDEKRELGDRPTLEPIGRMLRRLRPDVAELVARGILVERDQHLLRVRRKGMSVERECHGATSNVS